MFDLKNMGQRCEKNLIKYVDDTNACLLLDGAALVNAEDLKQFCLSYVVRHYYDVRKTDAFKQLRKDILEVRRFFFIDELGS